MPSIDLNCDMGEIPQSISDGTQESLMASLTSVNVACGGHAGTDETMKATIEQALKFKLAIGAHPSYADRRNFGRAEMNLPPDAIANAVYEQVRSLAEIAASRGARLRHVKPHGALYNRAARDPIVAKAIADGVARWSREPILVGLAGSRMLEVFREIGFSVAGEAFADRRYEGDGSLRSRKFSDSLIGDPGEALRQTLGIVQRNKIMACNGVEIGVEAQTICIHGDTPGSPAITAAISRGLRQAGVHLQSLSR
jgi:UPF0271 protein